MSARQGKLMAMPARTGADSAGKCDETSHSSMNMKYGIVDMVARNDQSPGKAELIFNRGVRAFAGRDAASPRRIKRAGGFQSAGSLFMSESAWVVINHHLFMILILYRRQVRHPCTQYYRRSSEVCYNSHSHNFHFQCNG